jgi:hypothetical protein
MLSSACVPASSASSSSIQRHDVGPHVGPRSAQLTVIRIASSSSSSSSSCLVVPLLIDEFFVRFRHSNSSERRKRRHSRSRRSTRLHRPHRRQSNANSNAKVTQHTNARTADTPASQTYHAHDTRSRTMRSCSCVIIVVACVVDRRHTSHAVAASSAR